MVRELVLKLANYRDVRNVHMRFLPYSCRTISRK
jgi:hypothetical protein